MKDEFERPAAYLNGGFFQCAEAVEGEQAQLLGVGDLVELSFLEMKAFTGSQDEILQRPWGFDEGC